MRILLIAYEFPPGPSPQSLRWARFSSELVQRGAELRVLTVQRDAERVRLPTPPGLVIDRTPAGAASGLIAHLRGQHTIERTGQVRARAAVSGSDTAPSQSAAEFPLNWKGRLVEQLNRGAGMLAFPDAFGQWGVAARRRLEQLLDAFAPDVVISSHEPATTLELGKIARERGFVWLADLGDPVLTSYTPARWRKRALCIEAWTCRHASHVIVTTAATRDLLVARHQVEGARFSLLSQGFDRHDTSEACVEAPVAFNPGLLELVYTGSFYLFRRPQTLVDAVVACEGARLTIATRTPPDWLIELADSQPDSVRLTGFLTHSQSVALQRGADILVNIANDDDTQIPGKLFEYLGAARPILHVGDRGGSGEMLERRRRGVVVPEHFDSLSGVLEGLVAAHRAGTLSDRFDLRLDAFSEFEWENLGARLMSIVNGLVSSAVSKSERRRI